MGSIALPRSEPVVPGIVLTARVAENDWATLHLGHRGGHPVAVKVYSARLASSARASERIERERQAHLLLDHPCIARLLGHGITERGEPYLVRAWIEGETLEERLRRGPLAWPDVRPIVLDAARGLRRMHELSIVHRDVKPSNIVLPSSGGTAACLIDYGHSLWLDQERLTDTGWTFGTAGYIAPELARGASPTEQSDLYALGVVLYRALTGVLPFRHASPAVVLEMHQRDPVPEPKGVRPGIDPTANDLAMWLVAKDPRDRVPSANVLMHTIR